MIHSLYEKGHTISEIARLAKLNRRTVRNRLKESALKPAKRIVIKPSKLDPFKDYIIDFINKSPYRIPCSSIIRDIKELGYTGGRSILQEFLTKEYRKKEVLKSEPIVRYETLPGEQIQVDWTTIRYGRDPIYAFVATLGYSRYSFVCFTNNMEANTLLVCHEKAFLYFGGVTKNILYDNMKTVVVTRNYYARGQHKFHPQLYDLAKRYGFSIKLCRPYRAQTKGKVENFNKYLKGNFYRPLVVKLKTANLGVTVDILNTYIDQWLIEANNRIHGTTNEKPVDRLNVELNYLLPYVGQFNQCAVNHEQVVYKPNYLPETIVRSPNLGCYDELLEKAIA